MRMRVLLVLLAVVAVGQYLNDYRLAHTECIPIYGSFFRVEDRTRRDNIKEALRAIRKYSPEDYERICTRATSIQIVRFEDQLTPVVPTDSLGSYSPDPGDISAKGVIHIDRETALGFTKDIEAVLVHEACHAFLMQTADDASQEPCLKRGQMYLLARPKMPLAERSAEMEKRTGEKFHTYCSSRDSSTAWMRVECVFINYTTELVTMCAKVFVKNAELHDSERNVCKDVGPLGYGSAEFTLVYPKGAKNTDSYQIGFIPDHVK